MSGNGKGPLLKQGPFTLTAACEPVPGGRRIDGGAVPILIVRSFAPGEFHVGIPTGTFPPQNGEVRTYLGAQASGAWATTTYSADSANGERAFGIAGAGRDVFGSTCAITVFQLG